MKKYKKITIRASMVLILAFSWCQIFGQIGCTFDDIPRPLDCNLYDINTAIISDSIVDDNFKSNLLDLKIYNDTDTIIIAVDSILIPHVISFLIECDRRNFNIDVLRSLKYIKFGAFSDSNGISLGKCYKYTNNQREVIINYKMASMEVLIVVLYHELGHCVLNKSHVCYQPSIMNPKLEVKYPEIYLNNWTYYVNKLFNSDESGCDVMMDIFRMLKRIFPK